LADETTRAAIKRVAQEAIASGEAGDLRGTGGSLLDPVPVRSPAGEPAGWFVPVARGDALLGFIQMDVAGRFHRSATFAPGAKVRTSDWLDADTIRKRARRQVGPEDDLGEPVLSYDGSPDRLAWLLVAAGPDGRERRVFVAGTAAWRAPERG
jgi:hypothetical protein